MLEKLKKVIVDLIDKIMIVKLIEINVNKQIN